MTIWQSQKSAVKPARELHIEHGRLFYYRSNGALTCIEIDDLTYADIRTIQQQNYWFLEDKYGAFALIPESCPQIGLIRRYLSQWRGFNYDGLLKFDDSDSSQVQLWPLPAYEKKKRA